MLGGASDIDDLGSSGAAECSAGGGAHEDAAPADGGGWNSGKRGSAARGVAELSKVGAGSGGPLEAASSVCAAGLTAGS